MRCILTMIGSTVIGFFVAVTFYTPTWNGYIMMPGVIVGVLAALICSVAFLLCPMKPVMGKAIALVLLVPSLWFAISCVMGLIYPGFM